MKTIKRLIAILLVVTVVIATVGCGNAAQTEVEAETVTAAEVSTEERYTFSIEDGYIKYYRDGDVYWQYKAEGVSPEAKIVVANDLQPTLLIQDGKSIWYCNDRETVAEKMTDNGYPCSYLIRNGDGGKYDGFVYLDEDRMYFQSIYPRPIDGFAEPTFVASGVAEIISEDFFIGVDGYYYVSTTFDKNVCLPEEGGIATVCLGDSEIVGRDIERLLNKQMSSKDFREKYSGAFR